MGLPRFDRVRSRGGVLHLSVPGVQSLALLAIALAGGDRIIGIRVRVGTWRPPKGWIGSPRLPGLSDSSLRRRRNGVVVTLTVIEPVDPAILVAAVIRMLRPTHLDTGPLMTICPGLPESAGALAAVITDVLSPDDRSSQHLRRTDTLVVARPDAPGAVPAGPGPLSSNGLSRAARELVITSEGWDLGGASFDIVVDPAVHRPVGRRSVASGHVSDAVITGDILVLDTPQGEVRARGDLSPADVHRLRSLSGVRAAGVLPIRWRAQLEAAGVVVTSGSGAGTLPEPGDDLGWQFTSVQARRRALRTHSPAAALDAWPTVSVVLVTHRDRYLTHALAQIARLDYPALQVVIGLHGVDLGDREVAGLIEQAGQRAGGDREVVVHRINRDVPFGQAMQVSSDRADGQLITKVDDDDHYAPEHVWDLVLARMYSGAQLVGKVLDWIHVVADDVTAFRPAYPAESYASFVAGGTMLISKEDLLAAGGWRPVPKSIDRALIEQVRRIGGLTYRTHGLGYIYVRHGGEHTAIVPDEHFLTGNARRWPGLVAHEAFGTVPA